MLEVAVQGKNGPDKARLTLVRMENGQWRASITYKLDGSLTTQFVDVSASDMYAFAQALAAGSR